LDSCAETAGSVELTKMSAPRNATDALGPSPPVVRHHISPEGGTSSGYYVGSGV
jgi:hypothetical protein